MDRRGRRLTGVAGAAALLALAAGCGGDDAPSAAERREYCDAAVALETAPEPELDFEALSPEELAAGLKEFASVTFRPLADRVIAVAPESLADEYQVLNRGLTQLEQTGSFEAFGGAEFEEAEATAHAYDLKNCDWEKVDVTLADYKFEDVPRTIDAGVTSFEVVNEGKEYHEMALLRKNDGVAESFDELLQLPEEEAFDKVTFMGQASGMPDEEGLYKVVDLQPGQYAMVCFIPQGTITEPEGPPTGEGTPHAFLGMTEEFTVED